MSTRKNEAARGLRVVISGDHIDYVEAYEGGRSVEANQVYRNKQWSAAEGHALIVVEELRRGGSTAVRVVTYVREGEFSENAAVRLTRERLEGARVKAHPAVSVKQERDIVMSLWGLCTSISQETRMVCHRVKNEWSFGPIGVCGVPLESQRCSTIRVSLIERRIRWRREWLRFDQQLLCQ